MLAELYLVIHWPARRLAAALTMTLCVFLALATGPAYASPGEPAIIDEMGLGSGSVPVDLDVNASTNRLYAVDVGQEADWVIDTAPNSILNTLHFDTSWERGNIAVNTLTNRVYVATGTAVLVFDGYSYAQIDTILLPNPYPGDAPAVAVDSTANRIYVTRYTGCHFCTGFLTVIDGGTDEVIAPVVESSGINARPAVNENTHLIYAATSRDIVDVIDGGTNTVVTSIPVGLGAAVHDVTVDSQRNRIYVGNRAAGTVSVIDGSSNSVIDTITVPERADEFLLGVNPGNNHLYVATGAAGASQLQVLDGGTGAPVASLAIPLPTALAVNSNTNRLYVANAGGTVLVIQDGTPPTPSLVYISISDSIGTGCKVASNPDGSALCAPPVGVVPYPTILFEKIKSLYPDANAYRFNCWGWKAKDFLYNKPENELRDHPERACLGAKPWLNVDVPAGTPAVVTITLGANDFEFSDAVQWWLLRNGLRRAAYAEEHAQVLSAHLRDTITSLTDLAPRAHIFVTGYYNAADRGSCPLIFDVGEAILWGQGPKPSSGQIHWDLLGLNDAIQMTADRHGAEVVGLYGPFDHHAVGSERNWLFGTNCNTSDLNFLCGNPLAASLVLSGFDPRCWKEHIDPHPNADGQICIANLLWEAVKRSLTSADPPRNDPCP